jgi:hypothetical protein
VLSLFTLVSGYAYIRYAYNVTDSFPFTQEIVLIIAGTLVTVFITALLLNKQSAVEVEKEQNILHLNLKTTTYQELLNLLEEMTILTNFSQKELIRLQFITHKLAIVASNEVIEQYQAFLAVIKEIATDDSFSGDLPQLHEALSSLTIKIRQDILGETSQQHYTQQQTSAMIKNNMKIALFSKKRDK